MWRPTRKVGFAPFFQIAFYCSNEPPTRIGISALCPKPSFLSVNMAETRILFIIVVRRKYHLEACEDTFHKKRGYRRSLSVGRRPLSPCCSLIGWLPTSHLSANQRRANRPGERGGEKGAAITIGFLSSSDAFVCVVRKVCLRFYF